MARTTAAAVQLILNDDYGQLEDGSLPSLTPFIDTANAIVSRVATMAVAAGFTLSTAELELIERWLSAHAYVMNDQVAKNRSFAGGVSATYQGEQGMYFEASKYGQMAMALDFSGSLRKISRGSTTIGVSWLGKPPSEQIDYADRD